jgi:DNA ligase 1
MSKPLFTPLLAPNQKVDLDTISYPLLASRKMDGCRCLFIKGQMLTRSLKPVPNKQLHKLFKDIIEYTNEYDVILDGEIFSTELNFQQIIHFFMTEDLGEEKIPESLKFHCFDMIKNMDLAEPFIYRVDNYTKLELKNLIPLPQVQVNSAEEVRMLFEEVISKNFEGLILRCPESRYKCGRGTLREGIIYKVKPFVTTESKVIDIIQATEVDPNAEKKITELGYSKTSQKKEDRMLIERASAVKVLYKDQEVKVTLACTNEEKEEIWLHKNNYIGKYIEYKFMEVGMKEGGLPRHPTSIRWRNDK